MLKPCWSTLVFLALATVAAAATPPGATVTLRSGERISCELVDYGGSGFTIRVNGRDRTIPKNEVALINFTGDVPADEISKIREGSAFVVLHGGGTFYGSLYDIGGTDPLRITFDTPDGRREVMSNDVARIYFGRWEGMPAVAAQPELAQGGQGMPIPANPCWTSTGISVQRGQTVVFRASGEIQLSGSADDIAGPAGSKTGRYARQAPIPSSLAGALIGRVGNGTPFGIGDQTIPIPMPATGQLFLGINDDACGDNRGEFRVQITPQRRR